jgi:hypothetical protein
MIFSPLLSLQAEIGDRVRMSEAANQTKGAQWAPNEYCDIPAVFELHKYAAASGSLEVWLRWCVGLLCTEAGCWAPAAIG